MTEMIDPNEVALRPLSIDDAALTLAWRTRPEIRAAMFNDGEIDPEDHARWLARVVADSSCAYHVAEHRGRPFGTVGFYAIAPQHRRAEWTFYVGDPLAKRGAGTAMLFLAIDRCFEGLPVEKLCGEVISSNPRSARLHERLGFQPEGNRTRHLRREGRPLDVALYALFADQWRVARSTLREELFSQARDHVAT